mmetsp:Transcript_13656/g.31051  ORF Transcript_13656/g.31051 Transcript_13656/m.31051 type:complete len:168 (-) Transcript_13656:128-631(-)
MTDPSSFQDHCKDIKSSIQADDQGDPDSHFKLGHWYELGRGVDQDYGKAVKYYNKAAHQGHAGAQFNLGCCYELGQGVDQDHGKAVLKVWLELCRLSKKVSSSCPSPAFPRRRQHLMFVLSATRIFCETVFSSKPCVGIITVSSASGSYLAHHQTKNAPCVVKPLVA